MKRLTRQRRHGQGKGVRSPLFWGGLSVAVLLLIATLTLLGRVDRMELPNVPAQESGKLIFYDALKKPGEDGAGAMPSIPDQKIPETHPEPNHPLKTAEVPPKPKPEPKKEPAPKAAQPQQKAEAPPAKPAGAEGIFAVQVAASKDKKAAEALTDRLVQNGYPGYMIKEDIPGKGIWYRVRVGPFDEKDAAREMIRDIQKKASLPGILVVERRSTK